MIPVKGIGKQDIGILLNNAARTDGTDAVESHGLDLRDMGSGSKEHQIKRIAIQFEELMINALLKSAFKEEKEEGGEEGEGLPLNSGSYKDLRTMFLSQHISDCGGLGYQKVIEQQVRDQYFASQEGNGTAGGTGGQKKTLPLSMDKVRTISANPFIPQTPSLTRVSPQTPPRSNNPGGLTGPAEAYSSPPTVSRPSIPGRDSLTLEEPKVVQPVEGRISSEFGWRRDPIDGKTRFHGGIDFAVPPHTPVKSFMEGEVVFCGWERGYGRVVEVRHPNGYTSKYGHNAELLVKKGDRIEAGKVIALSGSSGRSTGPHLHFEVRKDQVALNPSNHLPFAGNEAWAKK